MVFHMKTTLVIDDSVLEALRGEAARSRRTISELVESALRAFLGREIAKRPLPPLPTFDGGRPLVDAADRETLYDDLFGLEPELSRPAIASLRDSPATRRRGSGPASSPRKRRVRR